MTEQWINLDPHDFNKKRIDHNKRLLGKSVLVVGEDTAVVQSLVNQLAQTGADVVLLCWHMSLETGRKLQSSARSLGRRILLIDQASKQMASADQLFQTIQSEWGGVDLFIDMSLEKHNRLPIKAAFDEAHNGGNKKIEHIAPNWPLVQAFLKEIS